jgi:hypothetical protein
VLAVQLSVDVGDKDLVFILDDEEGTSVCVKAVDAHAGGICGCAFD